jgi:hypothetical protein
MHIYLLILKSENKYQQGKARFTEHSPQHNPTTKPIRHRTKNGRGHKGGERREVTCDISEMIRKCRNGN